MVDVVLVFQQPDNSWIWERIDPEFAVLQVADAQFDSVTEARADAEAHNVRPYRLEIAHVCDEESW